MVFSYWQVIIIALKLFKGGITMNKSLIVTKLLSLVLAGLIILSLAACGGSETGSSTDETQAATEAATSAQTEV